MPLPVPADCPPPVPTLAPDVSCEDCPTSLLVGGALVSPANPLPVDASGDPVVNALEYWDTGTTPYTPFIIHIAYLDGVPTTILTTDSFGTTPYPPVGFPVPMLSRSNVGTAVNFGDAAVGVASAEILAANPSRKSATIQNVGAAPIRVTIDGTAATPTKGRQLAAGETMTLTMPDCPTTSVEAIREGAADSTVSVTQVA